jgi:Holliday junction resolvasome RuvABC endonuclease subunit
MSGAGSPLVVGLDLSLTSTGYACVTAIGRHAERIQRPQYKGTERLRSIRDAIVHRVEGTQPALVVLEDYSFGSRNSHAHALGELGGVVRLALDELGARWVALPPSTLKKYATGRGNADKGLMLTEAVRRLGYTGSSNDEADALWLACAGHQLLGHPVVDVPKTNAAALDSVDLGQVA